MDINRFVAGTQFTFPVVAEIKFRTGAADSAVAVHRVAEIGIEDPVGSMTPECGIFRNCDPAVCIKRINAVQDHLPFAGSFVFEDEQIGKRQTFVVLQSAEPQNFTGKDPQRDPCEPVAVFQTRKSEIVDVIVHPDPDILQCFIEACHGDLPFRSKTGFRTADSGKCRCQLQTIFICAYGTVVKFQIDHTFLPDLRECVQQSRACCNIVQRLFQDRKIILRKAAEFFCGIHHFRDWK